MRSEAEYLRVLALVDEGMNDCAVSRLTGIPRGTVRDWRVNRDKGGGRGTSRKERTSLCPVCADRWLDEERYAYLLGMYLGDGTISMHPRGVQRLRVTCDLKYVDNLEEVASAIAIVRASERIGIQVRAGCADVNNYWKHWTCVFPQHGPGRKHEREIVLDEWQQLIVDRHPQALLRGLIHSDGNRHINEVVRPLKNGPKRYRYARYQFTNASGDIRAIFTAALAQIGVHSTQIGPRDITIARRADVASLDRFIGPKS